MTAIEARNVERALVLYERARDEDGSDPGLLAHVASLVLELEAQSNEPQRRDAAMTQLGLAGTSGRPALERLSAQTDHEVVRARALEVFVRWGDDDARQSLRALVDHPNPEILSVAIAALDPERDEGRVFDLLEHTSEAVRASAARALGGHGCSSRVLATLSEHVRIDPSPAVRSLCARSLGHCGPPAIEALRDRLGDPSTTVQLAVVSALVVADPGQARGALAPLIAIPPTPPGIEASRMLATGPLDAVTESARAFLRQALMGADTQLRSQAAVALFSLPSDPELDAFLLERLDREEEPAVLMYLASQLASREQYAGRARRVLLTLLEGNGMVSVQAAVSLARLGNARGIAKLRETLRDGQVPERCVAARALARDAQQPDAARIGLRDTDPLVRIQSAGGILAAAAN